MKLLDLFCGGGGAGVGYQRAGFDVVGVDINPHPNYPFKFYEADAMEFSLEGFDVIHASPPCQGYSNKAPAGRMIAHRLIAAVRDRLTDNGAPYVIENVSGARSELHRPITMCGTMFDLGIPRHRLFESSVTIKAPPHPRCWGVARETANRLGWPYREMSVSGHGRSRDTGDHWRQLLGIDWKTNLYELTQAIPPAYTEWIGNELQGAM